MKVIPFKFRENRQKCDFQVVDAPFNEASRAELKQQLQRGGSE